MDEASVRVAAEEHANAMVAKDLKTAGSVLTKEAGAQAGGVMKAMPGELTGCAIKDVSTAGDEVIVTITYQGAEGETTVESRWAEIDGRPMIANLAVL